MDFTSEMVINMIKTFEEANSYILDIPRFTTKNEPEKTKAFLNLLGDISNKIPTIHIAGTNGKGSVCAYLRAGLMGEGKKVGMFTSPHLVDIRERFLVDFKMISKDEFVDALNEVLQKLAIINKKEGFENYHPTFFEILFFMGVEWFSKENIDVLLLETGLGGRLDATNSISSPKVCVITEIGLDHMEYLGDTKELIAKEKAGIIKEGAKVVFLESDAPWSRVILDTCKSMNSDYFAVNSKIINFLESKSEGIDFSIHNRYDEITVFMLKTRALYQVENALLAYEALCYLYECIGLADKIQGIPDAFVNMKWPGRMEEILPGVIIDGAHNEDGVNAFLRSVRGDNAKTRTLLFSAVADKQIETVATLICDSHLFDNIYICHLDSYRAADTERLLNAFKQTDAKITCFGTTKDAVDALMSVNERGRLKYVAGSLYLVGEVKACLEEAL